MINKEPMYVSDENQCMKISKTKENKKSNTNSKMQNREEPCLKIKKIKNHVYSHTVIEKKKKEMSINEF